MIPAQKGYEIIHLHTVYLPLFRNLAMVATFSISIVKIKLRIALNVLFEEDVADRGGYCTSMFDSFNNLLLLNFTTQIYLDLSLLCIRSCGLSIGCFLFIQP
jgi:hypothetical protein